MAHSCDRAANIPFKSGYPKTGLKAFQNCANAAPAPAPAAPKRLRAKL
jgi:hypothetical protein